MSLANDYIKLNELFDNTSKGFIIDNVERLMGYSECVRGHRDDTRIQALVEATNSKRYTVAAWFNRSRENVKIPLLKLCMIAEYLNVDIISMLTEKLCANRDWDSFTNIDDRQRQMFRRVRETDFFQDGVWDVQGIIKYMDSIEDYSAMLDKRMQLNADCMSYFGCVVRLKSGTFIDDVADQITKYCENK